jgi:hypothetical protein
MKLEQTLCCHEMRRTTFACREKKGFDADPNQAKITATLFGERTADEFSRPALQQADSQSRSPKKLALGDGVRKFETTVP